MTALLLTTELAEAVSRRFNSAGVEVFVDDIEGTKRGKSARVGKYWVLNGHFSLFILRIKSILLNAKGKTLRLSKFAVALTPCQVKK